MIPSPFDPEHDKAQWVRLLDVFALGPLMVYVAVRYPLREPERTLLLATGLGTIAYNGLNYLRIARENSTSLTEALPA